VQIGDIMIDRVWIQNARSALVTLKQFLKLRSIDVTPFIQSIWTLQKEIESWCGQ
jgi:hypothetical protein